MQKVNLLVSLFALIFFVVSILLSKNYSHGSIPNEIGVGYFIGALFALMGFLFQRVVVGGIPLSYSDNVIVKIIDSLPFLILVPVAFLIFYAQISGKTGTFFNASSWVSTVLFGYFFWPLVSKADGDSI